MLVRSGIMSETTAVNAADNQPPVKIHKPTVKVTSKHAQIGNIR